MDRSIPRASRQRADRRTAARFVALACGLLFAVPLGLFAQGGDNIDSYYSPCRTFYIPFRPLTDPRIVDLQLYVSTDGRNYVSAAAAKPRERRFTFRANQDGWHYFIVQTVSQDGTLSPPDARSGTPNIRICIDSQKPVLRLEPARKEGFAAAIKWDIQDDNFDDVQGYYRSVKGGEWYPLQDLPRQPRAVHGWRPVVGGALEVHVRTKDKANNLAEQSVTITPLADSAVSAPAADPASNDIIYTNSKTFDLQFTLDRETIGPSKVAKIDIWKMRPGERWRKCSESGTCRDGESPSGSATVKVDAAGRWGFRLIPRSGVGLAERDPGPGDQPQIWVEVDETAPQVKITNVVVSKPPDAAELTIYWSASDAFLRARPISIFYATDPQGQWVELAKDLPHTGSYSCKPDERRLPFQFYVKVVAIDEAGNSGQDVWRDAVKVDLKVPRIDSIKVRPRESQQESSLPRQPAAPTQPTPPAQPPLSAQPAGRPAALPGSGFDNPIDLSKPLR